MSNRFESRPLDLPVEREQLPRADLIFYGVDHSGPTYEARVFLDNPKANARTELDADHGYAGSFTVFGHGGCFGSDGHCAPNQRHRDEFDRRPPHPLTPQTISLTVTEAVARLRRKKATVTVVAVIRKGESDAAAGQTIAPFDSVRLATYA